jgi:hypothetical protein
MCSSAAASRRRSASHRPRRHGAPAPRVDLAGGPSVVTPCAAPHGRNGTRPRRHLAYQAGVWIGGTRAGARGRRRRRVSQFAGSTTCCFRAATSGRRCVPVELSPAHEQRSAKRLGPAGRRAAAGARVHAAWRSELLRVAYLAVAVRRYNVRSGRASARLTHSVLTRRGPRRSCGHRRTARPLSRFLLAAADPPIRTARISLTNSAAGRPPSRYKAGLCRRESGSCCSQRARRWR